MKKEIPKSAQAENDEMRPEYDFRGAERGKHYKPLHEGYTVQIHQLDGTTVIEHYRLEEGAVMLQPDVREYFPDSDAVNTALRSLIALMSQMPDAKAVAQRTHRTGRKKRLTRNQSNPVKG